MHPIRADREREMIRNPWSGDACESADVVIRHVLDDDGCIESCKVTTRMANGCGCLAPAAGVCSRCGLHVCSLHFCHCVNCGAPLCQAHSSATTDPALRTCLRCSRASHRRLVASAVLRAILSRFVRFGEASR